MESQGFDNQIFGEFSGPLSPMGAKAIVAHHIPHHGHHPNQSNHSVQVMLALSHSQQQQQGNDSPCARLPEVHTLLPGSPKLEHYKSSIDYQRSEYQPNGQYSPQNAKNLQEYTIVNGKPDYSPQRIEYSSDHMTVFHQPPPGLMSSPGSSNLKKAKDSLDISGTSTPSTTTSSTGSNDASSTTNGNKKANEKNKSKTDSNGAKKKKTR